MSVDQSVTIAVYFQPVRGDDARACHRVYFMPVPSPCQAWCCQHPQVSSQRNEFIIEIRESFCVPCNTSVQLADDLRSDPSIYSSEIAYCHVLLSGRRRIITVRLPRRISLARCLWYFLTCRCRFRCKHIRRYDDVATMCCSYRGYHMCK